MDGVQVIGVAEGAMEPIIVHLCQNDLQAAEANQNPSNHPCLVRLSAPSLSWDFPAKGWHSSKHPGISHEQGTGKKTARNKKLGQKQNMERFWWNSTAFQKLFLQRNLPSGSLTASMRRSPWGQAGPHTPLRAIPASLGFKQPMHREKHDPDFHHCLASLFNHG